MNVFTIIGIVISIALFVTLCAMQILRFRNAKGDPGFDERQRMIQGRAYRDAFYMVLVALLICAVLNALNIAVIVPVWFAAVSIIVLGMGVYLTECNLFDAGLRPKEDAFLTMGGWCGVILINLFNLVGGIVDDYVDSVQFRFFRLFLLEISLLCLVLIIVNFVKQIKNRHRRSET